MKILFSMIILAASQMALASQPEQICQQNLTCTDEMKEISQLYQTGNADFIQAQLSGYSGICYHLDPDYDPSTQHHGAFVFEKDPQGIIALGAFSFFSSENPYQGLSVSELKKRLGQLGGPSLIEKTTDPVELGFNFPETQIHYWFRSLRDSGDLIVIGEQAHLTTRRSVFCRMKPHTL